MLNQSRKLLSVEHLSIQYQQQMLVQNLNFDLHSNEILAIVGESGSGKSLTALAMLNLLPNGLEEKPRERLIITI